MSGTSPETSEEYVEVHGGGEEVHVPLDDIDKIQLAALH